ncbi:hypothetical protein ABTL77_20365, partial [Acinetobacter baumannii]
LRQGGFLAHSPDPLPEGVQGPPAPVTWRWRPPRREAPARVAAQPAAHPAPNGAFAALAGLIGN